MRRPTARGMLRAAGKCAFGGACLTTAGWAAWRWNYERTRQPERFVPRLVDEEGHLTAMDIEVTGWQVARRYVELGCLVVPLLLAYPLTYCGQRLEDWWMNWFLRTVERAGPAFIKLAQWLATRRDLASPAFRKVLARLFNHVEPHSLEHTRRTIEEDFGRSMDELFAEFDDESVGSGSIAQVHRAVLRDDPLLGEHAGKKVAVKVCHPDIVHRIAIDLHVLNQLARSVDHWFPSCQWLELPRQTLAWSEYLAEQVDLGLEARNLDYFREHFRDTDDQVFCCFPEPLRPLVSQRVLIEEFVEGHTADYEFLKTLSKEFAHHVACIGMESYLKCLLRDNWLHGDMHPGNIIIAKEPEPGKQWPKVYLIDCGLALKLSERQAELSRKMIGGFARWKPDTVAEAFWLMGPDETQRHAKYEDFSSNLRTMMGFFQEASGEDEAVIGRCLEGCFDVVRDHKIQLEAWATNLMFGVLIAESFIMTLDNKFNIIKHVLPWLAAEGHFSWGMFRNQFGFVPWWVKSEDRTAEIRKELKAKGQLQTEADDHSWGQRTGEFSGGLLKAEARRFGAPAATAA